MQVSDATKMRAVIGRFGITGKNQSMAIKKLSDGLKSRVVFAYLAHRKPHMLLLDEPTNHLDIETIDSLAEGINKWDGGLVLVSHDFRCVLQTHAFLLAVCAHVADAALAAVKALSSG